MNTVNLIGLDNELAHQLSSRLNILLSNLQLFYINARGFHWNITGKQFFELHVKFEELYNDTLVKIDEVAERILTLGQTPVHTFTEYVIASSIKEAKNVSDGDSAISIVLDGFRTLIELEREIHSIAGKANDEGTSALVSDYIREQEKLVWMYSAYAK